MNIISSKMYCFHQINSKISYYSLYSVARRQIRNIEFLKVENDFKASTINYHQCKPKKSTRFIYYDSLRPSLTSIETYVFRTELRCSH